MNVYYCFDSDNFSTAVYFMKSFTDHLLFLSKKLLKADWNLGTNTVVKKKSGRSLQRCWGNESPLWQSMATRKHGKIWSKKRQNLFDDTHSKAAPILSQLRLIWRKPSEPTDRQDAPDKILLLQPAVGQSYSRGKECHTLECHITAASA